MRYVMIIVELIKLKVKKYMKLHVDSKGEVELANNWSVGDRTRHCEIKNSFLRELKD